MAKFVQICASQNDLFALDEEGRIHQYNFDTKTWAQLAQARLDETAERTDRWARNDVWRKLP